MKKSLLISFLLFSINLYADMGIVEKVVDGDTIKFTDKTSCRFANIDTPESMSNARLLKKISFCNKHFFVSEKKMKDSGVLSKEYLKTLISVGDSLEYSIISKDRYGRVICEVFKNNDSINFMMVKKGYAVPYNNYIKDSKIKQKYNLANLQAKTKKEGIYAFDEATMECLKITN